MASARPNMTRSRLLKVVLLGDGNVGKSSLMNRFVSNKFDSQSFHTIGVEFLNKEVRVGNQGYTLQIWDTAGQERFKSLRTPFYRGSDVCLLTFAVDDVQSFKNLHMWQQEFVHYADVASAAQFPFVVIGNKVDVVQRAVSQSEAEHWCKEHGMPYIEASAKDATNVDKAFQSAIESYQALEERLDGRSAQPSAAAEAHVGALRLNGGAGGSRDRDGSGKATASPGSGCC